MRSESSPETSVPRPESARDRILDAAMDLFSSRDIHTVGVDAIVAKAGVAKMSFYRHFPAKDDLVRAFLEAQDKRYWQWWGDVTVPHAGDPRSQLLALCDAIRVRLIRPTYRGCVFINFTAEFAQPDHPGYPIVAANKREQGVRILKMCTDLGVSRPEVLADQLVLLIEGARVSMLALGIGGPAGKLRESAEALIDSHLAVPRHT